MGKLRIKELGDEKKETELAQAAKTKREQKKQDKKLTKLKGKGGGRISDLSQDQVITSDTLTEDSKDDTKTKNKKAKRVKTSGKNYKKKSALVDKDKSYSITEAVALVKKTSYTKFSGTVEVHVNTSDKGLRGTLTLPHGTGKKIKVVIADDALIADIEQGKIDFDILVSHPLFMSKLAKVARILGPKGLMPNPKNGTLSDKPEELVKKLSAGQIQWKTENEAPIVHLTAGKTDFDDKKVEENLLSIIKSIDPVKIVSFYINATMGPSIKVKFS